MSASVMYRELRRAHLAIVDQYEKELDLHPRTAELRAWYKAQSEELRRRIQRDIMGMRAKDAS